MDSQALHELEAHDAARARTGGGSARAARTRNDINLPEDDLMGVPLDGEDSISRCV